MPWAIILVGALNVGSMATVWHGDVTPRKHREVTALPVTDVLAPATLAKGDEMARFNMGSTVILLFPPGAAEWTASLEAGQRAAHGRAHRHAARLESPRDDEAPITGARPRRLRALRRRAECLAHVARVLSARATCSKWKRPRWSTRRSRT